MFKLKSNSLAVVGIIFVSLSFFPIYASCEETVNYTQTIEVLRELYKGEMTASRNYSEYANKANLEGYDNIAHLFEALKASETIHARNFKNILIDLGVEVKELPELEVEALNTKGNLKQALKVELSEIDESYPLYVDKIGGENHEEAINILTYAWKAEQQHRDLIKKMQSASGLFFGKIEKKLEEADDYFICQRCGSTLREFPEKVCPICSVSAVKYEKVSKGELE